MIHTVTLQPYFNELPTDYADRLGLKYTERVGQKFKRENGQFFTPIPIARLMASFFTISKREIRILDPGCGTGILSCALVESLINHSPEIDVISLVAYETDPDLIIYSQSALIYLKNWLSQKGIEFEYILHIHDFVIDNANALSNESQSNQFDAIISNPPYFKLAKDDSKAIAASKLVSGQPNIYSIFMGISSRLLYENGEMVFITPRSFASGNYFNAFRNFFFNTVTIENIHLFDSRKETFNRDSVLQETIIMKTSRRKFTSESTIDISTTVGIKDITNPSIMKFKYPDLINIESTHKILHVPTCSQDVEILKLVTSWQNKLTDFNIQISTGPVVAFRATEYTQNFYENGTVFLAPLIWLHHVNKMQFEWPREFKEKPNYIRIVKGSKSILLPNKNYILLRRFSTKDDKSRLIAAPLLNDTLKSDFIGIENKLNYIYRKGSHLELNEVIGLSALLNSELFDTYFQIFNGNVNVSATEIREMKFPPLADIIELGDWLIKSNDYSMGNINRLVNSKYNLFKPSFEQMNA